MSTAVWNKSDKQVIEHVNGQEFVFAPGACLMVTERKAAELLKRRKDELTTQKPGIYAEEQILSVAKLGKDELVHMCQKLMRGDRVEFAKPAEEKPSK